MEKGDYNAALQDVISLINDYIGNSDNIVEESLLYQLQEDVNKLMK